MPRRNKRLLDEARLIHLIETIIGAVLVFWGIYCVSPGYEPSSRSLFYALPDWYVYFTGGFWIASGLALIYLAWRKVSPFWWRFINYMSIISLCAITLIQWAALGVTSLRWVFPLGLLLILVALNLRGQDDR